MEKKHEPMRIKFIERNEEGLHCRFCKNMMFTGTILFETYPIPGIVCNYCKEIIEEYYPPNASCQKEEVENAK